MILEKTRLHITPFTPDLLRAVLPASVADLAENVSFHIIQTDPDHNYGYLELPSMEAAKIKKKLNGAILKGKKMKVEEARPRKRRHDEDDHELAEHLPSTEPTIENTARNSKKSKKDSAVIKGHELSPERKIKRGWTEVKEDRSKKSKKDKSSRPLSKYTNKEELLFHTKVPANKKDLVKEEKKKKSGRAANGDVVHEFEKSVIQPSFLRSNATPWQLKDAVEYVDGKGWVDEEGKLVEAEPTNRRREKQISSSGRTTRSSKDQEAVSQESKSSSDDTPRPISKRSAATSQSIAELDDSEETSSSGSSSSDSASEEEEDSGEATSQASSGAQDRQQSPNLENPVHPLEALFKKPVKPASQDIAKPSLELQTLFSFFDPNDDDANDLEEEVEQALPGTPFSSQDARSRGHRSAAPTPDTAHPSRYNSYSSQLTASDEEEVDTQTPIRRSGRNQETPSQSSQLEVPQEQSTFEKHFWENRGELGRGWKRRRREVQKDKRQAEDRAMRRPGW